MKIERRQIIKTGGLALAGFLLNPVDVAARPKRPDEDESRIVRSLETPLGNISIGHNLISQTGIAEWQLDHEGIQKYLDQLDHPQDWIEGGYSHPFSAFEILFGVSQPLVDRWVLGMAIHTSATERFNTNRLTMEQFHSVSKVRSLWVNGGIKNTQTLNMADEELPFFP